MLHIDLTYYILGIFILMVFVGPKDLPRDLPWDFPRDFLTEYCAYLLDNLYITTLQAYYFT